MPLKSSLIYASVVSTAALAAGAGNAAALFAPGTDQSVIENVEARLHGGLADLLSGFALPGPDGDDDRKWGTPVYGTPGGTVTYSYMPTGTDCSFLFIISADCTSGTVAGLASFMPTGFKAAISNAFAAWEAVADIQFVEVADDGTRWGDDLNGSFGDIRIGGTLFEGDTSGALAYAFSPQPSLNGTFSVMGDIFFDTGDLWSLGDNSPTSYDIGFTALHEIGHSIGLGHECGDDGNTTPCDLAVMNPFYNAALSGLQQDDIDGAQFIYGPSEAAAVPLPAGVVLLGSGIALFGLVGMRRRKRATS